MRPGCVLASGSEDQSIKLWNADGTPLQTLMGHADSVKSVAWNDDSVLASGSNDTTIKLWKKDLKDDKKWHNTQTLTCHIDKVNSVAWSDDGRLASTTGTVDGDGNVVKIWY